MGKIKTRRSISLKWSFLWYLPVCIILAIAGAAAIGFATNDLQTWYENKHAEIELGASADRYEIRIDENGKAHSYKKSKEEMDGAHNSYRVVYRIISSTQVILVPLWVFGCVAATGGIFYRRELKRPIAILTEASEKIARNELDFEVSYERGNELGKLCQAFDEMRTALYRNNKKLWRSLEERKRLNAAFSHDLRTPLTVLRGYTDFLEKYIPDGKISEEKLISVLSLMDGQINRLEHYTQKMNAVQKLEDMEPERRDCSCGGLEEKFRETGKILCKEKEEWFSFSSDCGTVCLDGELVMQVYENLLSNAERYAAGRIRIDIRITENKMKITVEDDGGGFSQKALREAAEPFFREEKEADKTHFGLGLYISEVLCKKSGGGLTLENGEEGARVTAEFSC